MDSYTSYPFLYYNGGFLFIQDFIERGISSAVLHPDNAEWDINPNLNVTLPVSPSVTYMGNYMQEFPYPCYYYDEYVVKLSNAQFQVNSTSCNLYN